MMEKQGHDLEGKQRRKKPESPVEAKQRNWIPLQGTAEVAVRVRKGIQRTRGLVNRGAGRRRMTIGVEKKGIDEVIRNKRRTRNKFRARDYNSE